MNNLNILIFHNISVVNSWKSEFKNEVACIEVVVKLLFLFSEFLFTFYVTYKKININENLISLDTEVLVP